MTDEEVQRAMEEGTPVAIRYHETLCVGVITRRLIEPNRRKWPTCPNYIGWGVRVGGVERLKRAAEIRLATAEELLVAGDER